MDEQKTTLDFRCDTQGAMTLEDAQAYFDVIQNAFAVHRDRERMRNGLWKKYGPEDQARQIKIKADRIENALDLMQDTDPLPEIKQNTVEELYDIINYSVFGVRQLQGEGE